MKPFSSAVAAAVLLLAYAGDTAAQAVCGNGVREAAEHCDDGNVENLDGCSSSCRFEQVQRLDALKLQRTTAANCAANAFGGAATALGLSPLQSGIDSGVTNGVTSVLFVMAGLDDLSGSNDDSLSVGVVNAQTVGSGPGYDGTNDPDGWYSPDAQDIDGSRYPLRVLPAGISASFLTAGPGASRIAMLFAGSPVSFDMSSLTLRAAVGASSPPLMATSPGPPGHLASEHLDPALTSFATSGGAITGELCGQISAASLQAAPIPASFLSGPSACLSAPATPKYTVANSLLDVWVGGCSVAVVGSAVNATQPDKHDPDAPAAGAGPPYTLSPHVTTRIVDTCRDKNGTVVNLGECLADAAYSSFWKFQTERVIATRQCPNAPVAANDGPVCAGADVQVTAKGASGTYSWTGPNGFVSNLQNPTIVANADAAGLYEVTVTLAGCTSPPGSTTVAVNVVPQPQITAPSTVLPGATNLIASVTQTAGTTYSWSITNGAITAGQGTNQITFNAGSTGSVQLTVTGSKDGCTSSAGTATIVILEPPASVTAAAVASDRVLVEWTARSGAAAYEVVRTSTGGIFVFPPVMALTFEDTTVTPGEAYLYRVRSIDSSNNRSAASAADLATAIAFTDVLVPQTSAVRAQHVNELRTAVAAVRRLAAQPPSSFGEALVTGAVIRGQHLTSLRTALDEARSALALAPLVYTDSTLQPGITPVRAAHITELRSGTR